MAADGSEIGKCKELWDHVCKAFFEHGIWFSPEQLDEGHFAMEFRVDDVIAGRSDSLFQSPFRPLISL